MDFSPVLISLKTAVPSIAVTFFLGLFLAWGVAAVRGTALRAVLDGLLTLPLVLPPTVAGFWGGFSWRSSGRRSLFPGGLPSWRR